MSAFDRWLSEEPSERCPDCGHSMPDGPDAHLPEDERHDCDPMEPEPVGVGDREVDW